MAAKEVHQARGFEVICRFGEDQRESFQRPAETFELHVVSDAGENLLEYDSRNEER